MCDVGPVPECALNQKNPKLREPVSFGKAGSQSDYWYKYTTTTKNIN